MGFYDCGDGTAAGDPSGCAGPSTYNPGDISTFTGTGFSSPDAQSWINTLGGLFGTIYKTVNPPTPPAVIAGRGIPGSPGSLTPVKQTGVGTLLVIGAVALLVWFGLRR